MNNEVNSLPKIPDSWVWCKIANVTKNISLNQKIKTKNYLEKGILPVVDQGEKNIGGYINEDNKAVDCELPVIIFGDHTRHIKYINFRFAAGADGIKVLKPFCVFNEKLFYYFLQSIKLPNKGYARHYQYLSGSDIPLPPFNEQVRIISKIEELFSRLDAGVKALQQTQQQLEQYRQSILTQAFKSYARDFSVRDISTLIQYGTSEKAKIESAGIPVLRMGNIKDMTIDFTNLKYMPKDWNHPELTLNDGDLLFNRTNSAELVGKTAVYKKQHPQATFASYLIRVKINSDKYDPDLLSFFINSGYGKAYIKTVVSQQVGQANVNGTKLANMPIPNIPREKQIKVKENLEKTFTIIDNVSKDIKEFIRKLDKIKQGILKKAFEGCLVPHDPNDEPASVLLEKIRSEKVSTIKPSGRGRKSRGQMRLVE
jgi:type I restriction enzyme S subunit